jgi:hypothetical protein
MKKINNAVGNFIVDQGVYGNPHDVEIATHFDETVSVTSDWPGETSKGDMYLELSFESNTLAEFARVFGIRSVDDLTHITQEFLLYLYKREKAAICCTIDTLNTYYSLQFRKQNYKIWVTGEQQIEHEATTLLETPQQFMDYTRQRFLPIDRQLNRTIWLRHLILKRMARCRKKPMALCC